MGFHFNKGEVQVRGPKEKSINTAIHVWLDWSCLPVDTLDYNKNYFETNVNRSLAYLTIA